MRKALLLGSTGKMGRALGEALAGRYAVTGANSRDFDAGDPASVEALVERHRPDVLINTAAFLGIDPCARDPLRAFRMNTAFPRQLAGLAARHDSLLVHFSTDAVFPDRDSGAFVESDRPAPVNLYGASKLGGDWSVADLAPRHYIARISVLFGPHDRTNQFVEKMLERVRGGADRLRIADDIIASPCYSRDLARRVVELIEGDAPCGLYHVANAGRASLYELMGAICESLRLPVRLERASHREFPAVGQKNTCTPLATEKAEPLRDWRDAVADYCTGLQESHPPAPPDAGHDQAKPA